MNDIQLVKLCAQNNSKAVSELYTKYQRKITQICMKYTHTSDEHLDLSHDVFIKIITKIKQGKYKHGNKLSNFIAVVTKNHCLDYCRSIKPVKEYSPEQDQRSCEPKSLEHAELMSFINQMPEEQKQTFKLYLMGYAYQEISDELNIPLGTSKSRVNRIRTELSKKLSANGYGR